MYGFASSSVLGVRAMGGTALSVKTSSTCSGPTMMIKDPSPSMPFLPKPANLDESMVGYTGFDPLNLSVGFDVKWLQEAEIKHGRVCMLAIVGILAQEFVHLPNEMYSNPLATAAFSQVPKAALFQIFLFCGVCEYVLHKGKMTYGDMHADGTAVPGELGFNPMKMKFDETTQLKEIKNGRLAMCAVGGFIHSMFIYKTPIIAQLLNFQSFPGL